MSDHIIISLKVMLGFIKKETNEKKVMNGFNIIFKKLITNVTE